MLCKFSFVSVRTLLTSNLGTKAGLTLFKMSKISVNISCSISTDFKVFDAGTPCGPCKLVRLRLSSVLIWLLISLRNSEIFPMFDIHCLMSLLRPSPNMSEWTEKVLKSYWIFLRYFTEALGEVMIRTVFAPESTVIIVFPSQHNPVGCEKVLLLPSPSSFPSAPFPVKVIISMFGTVALSKNLILLIL